MYQFTVGELDALLAASLGNIIEGNAEYQATVNAIELVVETELGQSSSVAAKEILDAILLENQNKPHAAFYTLAAYFAEQSGSPTDANTIAWLRGAAGVNRGDTTASDFIRDYTAAQIFARSGQTVTQSQLQNASDGIATDVRVDILESGFLPSIQQIGQKDVAGTITSFANDGLPNDIAIWSGNLLFPGLGVADFFEENLLGAAGDAYDLFVAAYATQQAGYSNFLSAGASSPFALFSNLGEIQDAVIAAHVFLETTYGSNGLVLAAQLGTSDVVVGSSDSDSDLDQESELTSNTFIHGGGGNDTMLGSIGTDILRGGRRILDQ